MKKIAILGSTGSVGTQALDVVRNYPYKFKIVALSAGRNIDLLKKQIEEFSPEMISVAEKKDAEKLSSLLEIPVFYGEDGLSRVATWESSDVLLTSIVGSAGLKPTMDAIKSGKDIALANKETLVAAGDLVIEAAKKYKVKILPVDSEHSAIFQCLNGERYQDIKKLLLTCSGGPFRGKSLKDLKDVGAKEALNHPNWSMGGKISIDSSTLMNKGLEFIEAHHLFGIAYDDIEIVVHHQSIVHSMVEFVDGSVIAQLGPHDMRLPILYALSYPDRFEFNADRLNFAKIAQLNFEKPDLDTFRCLRLAIEAAKKGGSVPCVLNAANEIAVDFFLKGKIKWVDIAATVEFMLGKHKFISNPSLDEILALDKKVKSKTVEYLGGF